MTPTQPSLVQPSHLSREAFVYVRQSTMRQVADNTESTRRQYDLRQRAEALGWPADRVEVIDCDQGQSGTSAADREGFQRLVTEVSMGRVGIVLGLEVSRLARKCSDWHRLVELCAVTGTLILDQDGLYDPSTFNHELVLGVKGLMSAIEIGVLRARLRGALLDKASRGELRIGLPVGFVYDEQGQVRLHPDAQVCASVRLLFETFRRTGTASSTVKYFGERSLLFPRPAGRGHGVTEVVWRPLDMATTLRILHNPRYAGAYAYGRSRLAKHPEGRSRVTRRPRDEWHALVLDAHEGYIGWDDFERNEQRLRQSALAYGLLNRRSPPREGPALLQGLVVCGVCGRRMTVRYHQRAEGLVPDYLCGSGHRDVRQPMCQVIPGASVDRAVGQRLVASMTPVAIELTLAVRAELQARLDEADRLRMQQVERAQHEARLARRRYLQVDPDNRLVAGTLEADWNDKLQELARVREQAERQRAADRDTLDQATEARIAALASDFPAVWDDPATSHRDRKRMAQLLLEDVTLLRADRVHVHLRFKGGAVESLDLPLPQAVWRTQITHPDVVARVEELLEQYDEPEVVEHLRAEGLRTGAGKPFNEDAVRWIRYTRGLKTPAERRRDAGKLTVCEAAAQLGLSEPTVRAWVRQGRLRAERSGRRGTWLIEPLDDQPADLSEHVARASAWAAARAPRPTPTPPKLRARVDELLLEGLTNTAIAERLNEEGWRRPTGLPFDHTSVRSLRERCGLKTLRDRQREAGMLTSTEVAVRLGMSLGTVRDWARAGRLRGKRHVQGLRAWWIFAPIDEQPEPIRQRAAERAALPKRRGLLSDAAAAHAAGPTEPDDR